MWALSAAFRYQLAASTSSFRTPQPLKYMFPRPVASYLLPDDEILTGDFLRRLSLHLKAERSDFLRRGGPERFDLECYEFRIAYLLSRASSHCLDCGSALHHGSARWERG